jgi:peptidoglycan/LPS O-acetylase OafA/YrhL
MDSRLRGNDGWGRNDRVSALNGLRGLACLMVVSFHMIATPIWRPLPLSAEWWIKNISSLGLFGVDLFFVLSGFLLGGSCLSRASAPHSLRSFYRQRAARILPLYFIFLVLGSLLLSFVFSSPKYGWIQRPDAPLWPFFLQLQNFQMAHLGKLGPYWLSPTWSLAVQVHFYLVLPLVIYKYHRSRALVPVLLAFILGALLLRGVLWLTVTNDGVPNYILTPCRWDSLFIGVLGAWIYRNLGGNALSTAQLKWLWMGAALSVLWVIIALLSQEGAREESIRVFLYPLVALSFLCLLFLALFSPSTNKFFAGRWLQALGDISYPIYLIHPLVFGLLSTYILQQKPFFTSASQLWISVVCFFVSLALSAVLQNGVKR